MSDIGFSLLCGHLVGDYLFQNDWQALHKRNNTVRCLIHCALYTFAVWLFTFSWITPLGLAICFVAHFLFDRFGLARRYMSLVGQEQFATGPCSPWSIIVVDNTFHILTLYLIGALA